MVYVKNYNEFVNEEINLKKLLAGAVLGTGLIFSKPVFSQTSTKQTNISQVSQVSDFSGFMNVNLGDSLENVKSKYPALTKIDSSNYKLKSFIFENLQFDVNFNFEDEILAEIEMISQKSGDKYEKIKSDYIKKFGSPTIENWLEDEQEFEKSIWKKNLTEVSLSAKHIKGYDYALCLTIKESEDLPNIQTTQNIENTNYLGDFKWEKVDSVDMTKLEIYNKTKLFITQAWKSNRVIQLDDKESGTIVVEGVVIIELWDYRYTYSHTLTFRQKEGKYKIKIDNVRCESVSSMSNFSQGIRIEPSDNIEDGLGRKRRILVLDKLKSELNSIIEVYPKYLEIEDDF